MKSLRVLFAVLISASAVAAQTPKTVPSVSADIEVVTQTTLSDGNQLQKTQTQHFYRDSLGRTRLENGDTATINDVVAHQIITLDLMNHTAQRLLAPPSQTRTGLGALSQSPKPTTDSASIQSRPGTPLGSRNINGFDTEGKEVTSTIPANSSLGNMLPIQRTTRVWQSTALHLPLMVEIQDPLHGHITMQYKNLQAGALLDPILFEIPKDFTVTERSMTARPGTSVQFPRP